MNGLRKTDSAVHLLCAQVSGPCIAWVSRGSNNSSTSSTDAGGLLVSLIDGLLRSVRSNEEGGTMHARRLSTALLFLGV